MGVATPQNLFICVCVCVCLRPPFCVTDQTKYLGIKQHFFFCETNFVQWVVKVQSSNISRTTY